MNIQELLTRKKESHSLKTNTHIFNKEEILFINKYLVNIYKTTNITKQKLCDTYPFYNRQTLTQNWKRLGLQIDKHHSSNVRLDLFKSIKTEKDAYWWGFVLADGYISDANNFELSLTYLDYNHLLKFADYCGFDKSKVKKKQKTNFPNSFRSRMGFKVFPEVINNFHKLGIVPRKSNILVFPKIKASLKRHFIRGYFDGDGCISSHTHNRYITPYTAWQINFVGTKDFLIKINAFFEKNTKIYNNKGKAYSLAYGGNKQVKRFTNILYKDATIYLDRKYEKYCRFIEQSIK